MSGIIDPDATLDWTFDWSEWLADGDTITAHTVTVISGSVTVAATDETDGVVTVWLTDATAGPLLLTCHIETDQGRADDRTRRIAVVER